MFRIYDITTGRPVVPQNNEIPLIAYVEKFFKPQEQNFIDTNLHLTYDSNIVPMVRLNVELVLEGLTYRALIMSPTLQILLKNDNPILPPKGNFGSLFTDYSKQVRIKQHQQVGTLYFVKKERL